MEAAIAQMAQYPSWVDSRKLEGKPLGSLWYSQRAKEEKRFRGLVLAHLQPERRNDRQRLVSSEVKRLQLKLQEEIELHTFLESVMEKDPWELSSTCSVVPHPAQEILSNIATLETAVTKLEQEMMSLNFQLSQERNERRLAEYHLAHLSSLPVSLYWK